MWLHAPITFVKRSGSLVVPFLSLHLTKDMGPTLEQVGWIMACFGVVPWWAPGWGGRLADRSGSMTS